MGCAYAYFDVVVDFACGKNVVLNHTVLQYSHASSRISQLVLLKALFELSDLVLADYTFLKEKTSVEGFSAKIGVVDR